jgi:hypothetical protein
VAAAAPLRAAADAAWMWQAQMKASSRLDHQASYPACPLVRLKGQPCGVQLRCLLVLLVIMP